MTKTVLVTGATGFLGSHLVKGLLKHNHQVIILKRSFSDTTLIKDVLSKIDFYDLDKSTLSQPFEDYGNIDAVIHTATNYGRNNESITDIFQANLAFPLHLLETASKFNTNLFFNTDTYFNTNHIVYNYLNSYSLSKKHFLEWGKQFTTKKDIRFINIKLEHIFGADKESKFTAYVIKSCLENVLELQLTAGEQKRDFIYVEDVVSVYLLLLEKAYQQANIYQSYNVGMGETLSIRNFVEMVHRITHSKTKLNFGSLPYRDHEIMESKADIQNLIKLGWKPKYSVEQGIRKAVSHYLENGIGKRNEVD